MFQGPILTLTLKDPFANNYNNNHNTIIERATSRQKVTQETQGSPPSSSSSLDGGSGDADTSTSATEMAGSQSVGESMRKRRLPYLFWSRRKNTSDYGCYTNFLNLRSLSPTVLCAIRSTTKPLPYYLPSLHSTSITAGYQYDDSDSSSTQENGLGRYGMKTATSPAASTNSATTTTKTTPTPKPTFIEGELKFRKRFFDRFGGKRIGFPGAIEVDIAPSYLVREKKVGLVVKVGGDDGGGTGSTSSSTNSATEDSGGYGCYALIRFAWKTGKEVRVI